MQYVDEEGFANDDVQYVDEEGFATVTTQPAKMTAKATAAPHTDCECDDSDSDYEEDSCEEHSKVPKVTKKPVATTVAVTKTATKERFSDMLREAPSGSCLSSDFASF